MPQDPRTAPRRRRALSQMGSALAAGGALAAYAALEPRLLRLVRRRVSLGPGRIGADVLHLSDTHLIRDKRWLAAFVASLPGRLDREPDLIIATGDLIDDDSGIDLVHEAFAPLDARWGKFYVLGSHDYFQSVFEGPAKYLREGPSPKKKLRADVARLERGLAELGWRALTNTEATLETKSGTVRVSGVDDPYIKRHSTAHVRREEGDVLAIGAMHAPDVVSEFALAGFDLLLAGHTHAGQVRIPGIGALVTNCTIPAEIAGGLTRVGSSWLHVSPGLGNGTYSPIRFLCRPEATLLRLEPSS